MCVCVCVCVRRWVEGGARGEGKGEEVSYRRAISSWSECRVT